MNLFKKIKGEKFCIKKGRLIKIHFFVVDQKSVFLKFNFKKKDKSLFKFFKRQEF